MFYVYSHLNPIDKKTFYVGKGTGTRARSKTGRSPEWNKIVEDLFKVGLTFEVKILHICNESTEANKLEKAEIKSLLSQGCVLTNKHVNSTDENNDFEQQSRAKTEAKRFKRAISEAVDEAVDKRLQKLYKQFREEVSSELLKKIKENDIQGLLKTLPKIRKQSGLAGQERMDSFVNEVARIFHKNEGRPLRRIEIVEQCNENETFAYLAIKSLIKTGKLKPSTSGRSPYTTYSLSSSNNAPS